MKAAGPTAKAELLHTLRPHARLIDLDWPAMRLDPALRVAVLIALLPALACNGRRWESEDDETPSDDDGAADDDATGDDDSAGGDDDSSSTGDDDGPQPDGLACAPSVPEVEAFWPSGADLDFNANVHFEDGTVAAGGAEISWSVLEGPSGGIDDAGVFHASSAVGGLVRVRAQLGALQATCQGRVIAVIHDEPAGVPGLVSQGDTPTTADAGCAAPVQYPLEGSTLPASLGPPTLQWNNGSGGSTTLLRLAGPSLDVTVAPVGNSWTPTLEQWAAISQSAGADDVIFRVLQGNWDGVAGAFTAPPCEAPAPLSFRVGDIATQGSVFYWSPSLQGLLRLDVGAPAPVEFITASSSGHCVGCHSANLAQPDRMAMTFDGGNGWNTVLEVEDPTAFLVPSYTRNSNFSTLSPDGTRLVRTYNGILYLDNVDTNSNIGTVPTSGHASHPDWSPDGTRLTYVSCSSAQSSIDYLVSGCAVRIVDVGPGDTWGADVEIVPQGSQNNYYPSFSPDSQWIVFNRSTGDAYDDVDASLWAVSALGGTPVELVAANSGTNIYNSWPRWVPGPTGSAWLTFSSRRPYGNIVAGTPQIWLSHIDLSLLAAGLDPSRAPAWMVGQSTSSGNHTPVWVPRYTPQ